MATGSNTSALKGPQVQGLEDSTPLLSDPVALRKKWDEDHVLFFKGVIGKDAVAKVRDDFMRRLKDMGLVAPGAEEPVWNGVNQVDGADLEAVEHSLWRELAANESFDSALTTLMDGAPAWLPIVVYRASHPLAADEVPEDTFVGRHQDGFYNNGVDFITCWVPLMKIDDEVGGLAVVPGSHKVSLHDVNNPPMFSIPRDAIADDEWRRGDYEPGDVIVFHNGIAHSGLPNQSDKFRLSLDIRFLPPSAPKPIHGVVTGAEGRTAHITDENGAAHTVILSDESFVRGPKGNRVTPENFGDVLFEGNRVMAVPDENGVARLFRTMSRQYLDLPHTWYTTMPPAFVV